MEAARRGPRELRDAADYADGAIIAPCNRGLESSHVDFALHKLLGYPHVRVYDGSFTEWLERVELPVKTGQEP